VDFFARHRGNRDHCHGDSHGDYLHVYFHVLQKLTLNVMTLSGLALGSGMLVDNSIVVLDNIAKKREKGMASVEAACTGADEMWLSIFSSTLTRLLFSAVYFFK